MITFDHVSKRYGNEHDALRQVSFQINAGEFVCITGPSGVGKTTIAKLILGAEHPTTGTVSVQNMNVATLTRPALDQHRQHIGTIFQDFKLLPDRTVFENVAFVLYVCGVPDDEITERVNEALSIVHLEHARDKFPLSLSGGEQQRVALARAIVHRPRVLIADEPTGNLDQANATEVISLLKAINAFPTTVLLMTHDEDIVRTLNGRVIELKDHTVVNL